MGKSPDIKQVSTIGARGTQVGVQNITYEGMSPLEASKMAINLFEENFPKLREEARKVAKERIEELCKKIIEKLENEGVEDFTAFKEPDTQYALVEAQKSYARFGSKEMLETLSGLLCKRVQNDKDFKLKVTIDKAIDIASMITTEQINYLSYLFDRDYAKKTNKRKKTLKEVIKKTKKDDKTIDFNDIQYLLMHGCLILNLHSVTDRYISRPRRAKKQILDLAAQILCSIGPMSIGIEPVEADDYSLSYVGIILAITNIEIKTGQKLDPHDWIK